MSTIPSLPAHSLGEVGDEKTYDALVDDHRAQRALDSLATLERAYRRTLADLADLDAELAGAFIDESQDQRAYLPYLVGTLRNIRLKQRPIVDAHWMKIHDTIRTLLESDGEPDND